MAEQAGARLCRYGRAWRVVGPRVDVLVFAWMIALAG